MCKTPVEFVFYRHCERNGLPKLTGINATGIIEVLFRYEFWLFNDGISVGIYEVGPVYPEILR